MRLLATRVMHSPVQAALLAALFALLSLLLPPLSLLSSAVVGLRTLRNGMRDGALVIAIAGTATLLLGAVMLHGGWGLGGLAIGLWLPVWLLGGVLHYSRSLPAAIMAGIVLGGLLIAAYQAGSSEPTQAWREMLVPLADSLDQAQMLAPGGKERLVEVLSRWMTGILATGFFLQTMAALLLARWWQAQLYNPGGFRREFHELRLPRGLAAAAFALLLANAWLGSGEGTLLDFAALLVLSAFLLQGIALVHGVLGAKGAKPGWLIGFYLLWLLALPQMVTVLATAGLVDAWIDFRARIRGRNGSGGVN